MIYINLQFFLVAFLPVMFNLNLPVVLGCSFRSQFLPPAPIFDIPRYNTGFDRENFEWEGDHVAIRWPMNDLRCTQMMLDDLLSTERLVPNQTNRHLRKLRRKYSIKYLGSPIVFKVKRTMERE